MHTQTHTHTHSPHDSSVCLTVTAHSEGSWKNTAPLISMGDSGKSGGYQLDTSHHTPISFKPCWYKKKQLYQLASSMPIY